MEREQTYQIECGNVTFRTSDGWGTSRQVGSFSVCAISFEHAAKLAKRIMLSAADPNGSAEAFFGMLDENHNYQDESGRK